MIAPITPPNRFVVFHRPGPGWRPGRSAMDQPAVAEHLAYLMGLAARGRILMSGPFLDGSGGMAVLAVDVGEAEARRIVAEDPAVCAGIVSAELRVWMTTIDHVSLGLPN